ncbi:MULTISPECIES: acyl carrier protein [unclassified Streptomyces]|uniref:acyl carrier protein n=1 Tax=unclassified Streptomyces TaxID=2593676 RepID=UPI00278C4446|nr:MULTISPECIES: acyl carrier protein [unclassified Streptomyces]
MTSTPPMTGSALMTHLTDWIQATNPEAGEIAEDLDIIETRSVTSLQFVEFLLFIEELRGAPIPPDDMDIDSFRTLRSIVDRHLAPVLTTGE